jgi:hypothetical protein
MRSVLFVSLGLLAVGCERAVNDTPQALPALSAAPLTTDQMIQLVHPMVTQDPSSPLSDNATLQKLIQQGFGETSVIAGEGVADHTLDGSPAPTPSVNPTLVTRFVHLTDVQLSDDESPARLVDFDSMGSTYAAYRPQEAWICRMLNSAVRTINKVHETSPIEFVIGGGDNADNAQTNENAWVLEILDGAPSVKCDSGDPDDPVRGPNNDPKDAFIAEGLKMPWHWVTGNHDVLNQGNFTVESKASIYTGTEADLGAIDWSSGTPKVVGTVVPDPQRAALNRVQLMLAVANDGDGHSIGTEQVHSGKAYYHFDVAGGPLRIVVMDTAAETGGDDGVLHRADMMQYVKPALDEAETLGKYSIIVSHHGPTTLQDGNELGGTAQADAVLPDEWRAFLAGYPHVIMHLGAHTHLFRAAVAPVTSGHAFFEAETDSLADWPNQVRMFEVWEHDQFIEVRAIPIDFSDESDPVVMEGRKRAAVDFSSGWVVSTVGPGPENARAMSLWFPKVM